MREPLLPLMTPVWVTTWQLCVDRAVRAKNAERAKRLAAGRT